jgi:pSer/pThr/pTyr-binding forkhead associated (FHA) protein
VVGGRIHVIQASCVIGRAHADCPSKQCIARGFLYPPDVSIIDPQGYVSRHHVAAQLDKTFECWVCDLQSLNGSAIIRRRRLAQPRSVSHVERLAPNVRYRVSDGDIIALGYHPRRGPYFVITYHKNGFW